MFTYSNTCKALVTIFFFAKETISSDSKKTLKFQSFILSIIIIVFFLSIKAAPDSVFSLKLEQASNAESLSSALINEKELKTNLEENEYFVIIKMEEDELEKKEKEILYSYGRLGERKEGNEYIIDVFKQKIEVDGRALFMYEIFGGKLTENKTRSF